MAEWPDVDLFGLAAAEKSAISKPYGSAFRQSDYCDSGIPVVRGVNLARGRFHDDDFVYVVEDMLARVPGAVMRAGDLVVTHRGTVGQVSMVPRSPRFEHYVASTSQVKVRLDESRAVPEFYYYWFMSPQGRQSILEGASTVGVPGIAQPVSTVKALRVPVPPIQMQRAIADVLGALDDKIAANTELATTADALAALTYRRAVARAEYVPMSSRLTPILGGTPARANEDFWNGEVPWISAKDVTAAGQSVVLDTAEHITARATAETKAKPLPIGSVILTARGTVGAVARLAVPAAFNQSCYGFRPDDVPAGILYFAMLSAADEARSLAHGSVFDTITKSTFDHLSFPSLDGRAMSELETHLAPLMETVVSAERENQQLAATRDALLPALMSGRLRVEEAAEVAGL